MRILKIVSIFLIISIIALGCGSGGGGKDSPITPSTETTTVSGTVLDENDNPIEGAVVTIMSDPVTVTTDANGFFSATVEIGTHTIEIKMGSILIHSGQLNCEENTPLLLGNITADNKKGDGDPDDITCSDNNNIDQPDMTGNPFWSSSTAYVDSEVMLSVPVDEDTGYVGVTLFHTQFEGGATIAIGGGGLVDITPGQARTVNVPVNINFLVYSPLAGNYFPVIHLCRSAEECIDGQNIHYAGSNEGYKTITNGDQYGRVHNNSTENVDSKKSCFLIPILSVTE